MKTNILKLVLPAFAILLAVGLAFATETDSSDQTAYYQDSSGIHSITIGDDCVKNGANPCKFNGHQLYAEMALSNPLGRTL